MLTNGEVNVWLVSALEPPVSPAVLETTLTRSEAGRAVRFARREDRDRFVIGRGILRRLLGSYLSVEPERVELADGPHGKPRLAPGSCQHELQFNVAHSGAWIAIAIARGRSVGVDVERIRPVRDAEALARRFFAPGESSVLKRLPRALRREGFFACWTRKEAVLKAVGAGLDFPLARFEVTVHPREPAAVVSIGDSRRAAGGWSLSTLRPEVGYIGAVASFGATRSPVVWRWTSSDGDRPTRMPHEAEAARGPRPPIAENTVDQL